MIAPIVIEFEAPLERVYVDPRDFLCTMFQLWNRDPRTERDLDVSWLMELFGPAICRYLDAASGTTDQTYRIAMCHLASFDEEVVLAHHSNARIIGGRYRTHFESAFFVQAPIGPESIRNVRVVSEFSMPTPDVSLALI